MSAYWMLFYYDLYRRLRLQFLVLLMMGAVTPETCRVTLQWNKSDCVLLHLVGLLFNMNYDARNHELKKVFGYLKWFCTYCCYRLPEYDVRSRVLCFFPPTVHSLPCFRLWPDYEQALCKRNSSDWKTLQVLTRQGKGRVRSKRPIPNSSILEKEKKPRLLWQCSSEGERIVGKD